MKEKCHSESSESSIQPVAVVGLATCVKVLPGEQSVYIISSAKARSPKREMLVPTIFSLLCLSAAVLVNAVPGRLNASSYHVPHFAASLRAAKKRQLDGLTRDQQQQLQQPTPANQQSSPIKFSFDENVKLQYVENELAYDCPNCADDVAMNIGAAKWTMPLLKLGEKRYYLGIFFKANWYRAAQYCRYHGMHLASINSQEENDKLEKHIRDFGLAHEHFWTSGTDQAEEGTFFWMANGRPITFENWNAGEPNNFRYENGEEEHCLELWNRDGKGLKWNDSPCSFETFFVCEVQ